MPPPSLPPNLSGTPNDKTGGKGYMSQLANMFYRRYVTPSVKKTPYLPPPTSTPNHETNKSLPSPPKKEKSGDKNNPIDIENLENQVPEDKEEEYHVFLTFPFPAKGIDLENAAQHSPELKYRKINDHDLVLNDEELQNLSDPNSVGTQGSVNCKRRIFIKEDDLNSVNKNEELTVNIVDFLMKWIGRTIHEKSDVYIYRTNFYLRLREDMGKNAVLLRVLEWKNTCTNPFDKHILLLPILLMGHWMLAVVLNPGAILNETNKNGPLTCVLIFDSMAENGTYQYLYGQIYSDILTWLNNMWNEKGKSLTESNEKEESTKVLTKETCKMFNPKGT